MFEITTTFTADISLTACISEKDIARITSNSAKERLAKMIGADTVDIRNFKVFVHEGEEE